MLQNATKPTSGLYQVKIIFFKYKKVYFNNATNKKIYIFQYNNAINDLKKKIRPGKLPSKTKNFFIAFM